MSSNVHEQSQTNLTHRLTNTFDIRKLSASTTLSDVDCGKFLYIVFLNANITLTLPDALTCIGGEIRGMVTEEGTGNHTLTILAKNNQLIDGKGSAGVYENVAFGFPFTATSTGRNWCLVAGVGADGGTGDLDMGGYTITNCPRFETNQNSIQFSFNNVSPSTLVLYKPGLGLPHTLVGDLSVSGELSARNPNKTFFKTSAFQAIDPNINTDVSWPDNLSLVSNPISIDGLTKKRVSFANIGTYLVSWSISWQGSSDYHTVETGVNVQVTSGLGSTSTIYGHQKLLGNSDETIQTCTAVVTIDNLASFLSVFVKHSASTPLNVPSAVDTGEDTMQLLILKLF